MGGPLSCLRGIGGDMEIVRADVDAPHRVAERVAYGKSRAPSLSRNKIP